MLKISDDGKTATFSINLETSAEELFELKQMVIRESKDHRVLLATIELVGPRSGFIHVGAYGKAKRVEAFSDCIRQISGADEE